MKILNSSGLIKDWLQHKYCRDWKQYTYCDWFSEYYCSYITNLATKSTQNTTAIEIGHKIPDASHFINTQ